MTGPELEEFTTDSQIPEVGGVESPVTELPSDVKEIALQPPADGGSGRGHDLADIEAPRDVAVGAGCADETGLRIAATSVPRLNFSCICSKHVHEPSVRKLE